MIPPARTVSACLAALLAVGGLGATTAKAQVSASPAVTVDPAPRRALPLKGARPAAHDEASGSFPEPSGSMSAQLRAEQAQRRELREAIGWWSLDDSTQESLWDTFVGPDQINDGHGFAILRPSERRSGTYVPRGGYEERDLLYSLSWSYTPQATGSDSFLFDMDLNVEGDVALAGTYSFNSGVTQVKGTEIKGTSDSTQGYTQNWSRTFYEVESPASNGYLEGKACVSDLSGHTYVCGSKGNGKYYIIQFDGADGSTLGRQDFTAGAGATDATIFNAVVDPEGILYVAGTCTIGGVRTTFMARHNPGGAFGRGWIQNFDHKAGAAERVAVDRRGDLYLMDTSLAGNAIVRKISPYDGSTQWTWTGAANSEAKAFTLDFTGNPHVAVYTGAATNDWNTVKLDVTTGAALWTRTITNGVPKDIAVDPTTGNVFVVGTKGSSTFKLVKYDALGNVPASFVSPQYGTTGTVVKVALDWIGNPYVSGYYGTTNESLDTRKFDADLGAVTGQGDNGEVWHHYLSPTFNATETNHQCRAVDLVVDAGGSVYIGGYRQAYTSGNSYLGTEFFCVRLEQPFVSIPQIVKSVPNVRIENHSIWLPENSDPAQSGFNTVTPLFAFDVDSLLPESVLDPLLTKELNYLLGTVHGEVDLDYIGNTTLGAELVTTASSGGFDATATGEVSIAVPGEAELFANQPFNVAIQFKPDEAGMELLGDATPTLSVSINSAVTGDIHLGALGMNRLFGGDWETFFSVTLPTPHLSTLDNRVLVPILGANPPPPGTSVPFSIGGVSGTLTMPDLSPDSTYTTVYASGNTTDTDDDDKLRLSSSLSETFCDASVSITDLMTQAAVGLPLSYGYALPGGDDDTNVEFNVGLLQAHLDGNMKIEQALTLDMKPYVRLEFPGTSLSPITVDLVKRSGTSGAYTFGQEANGISVGPLPASGVMEIRPYFGIRSTMQNTTGLRFGASAGFDAVILNGSLTVAGVDVFSFDEGWGSVSTQLFSQPITLFNHASPEFAWPEVELASIQVSGSTVLQPELIGASRAAARMIIYEQRSPTQAELNAVASGTEPMVLYGRKLFTGTGQANRAFIRHCGRTEQLTTTRLNDQALLVQMPRRFYLLPGVARIWVTNGNGKSKSIDFPIEHPVPNFLGVDGLDGGTNPEVWAGDPRRTTNPLIANDGGTPAGNDSFIARRDYYTLLRTSLWNPGLFPPGDPDATLSAQAYFPSFPSWELSGQPKAPPGFPSLVVDGVALPRQRPYVNDGNFRSMLTPGLYASPHVATMTLVNPGPGGGPSRTLTMTIPAPKPVLSSVEPATINPEAVAAASSIRLTVYGPDSVPYFNGYEAPKAGNFTPESVVNIDGTAVTTMFSNSGQLTCEVPAALLASTGAHRVTVTTPSGGTTYTEQLRTGAGVDLPAEVVDSGGTSVALNLTVTWPEPVISTLSVPTLHVGQIPYTPTSDNGGPPPDAHNFTICGSNFAPGCTVFWNGRAVTSTRNSAGELRITVTPGEVAAVGAARIWVTNPSPSRRSSEPKTINIVP